MTEDIVSVALARRIPALSSHRFLLSAHSLRCLNDWTIEDVLHWLLCQEHPLNTICGDACMCMCVCLYLDLLTHCHQPPGIHLAASPLLPASLHFLLCLAELLVSSIILKMNRTGSFFFLSLTARLCLPACLLLQAGSAHSRWINLALLGATHHILESDCFPHTLTRWPAHSSITEIGGQTDERARGGKGKCTNMCIMLVRTTFGLSDVNLSGRYAEFSVGRKKAEQCCPAVKVIASKPTNEAR